MATWEDGPEYAPLERPDAFSEPDAATSHLDPPPPPPPASSPPLDRPRFDEPGQQAPALADLVPTPPEQRDPEQAFDVASSLVTAESSAWAAAHWTPPSTPDSSTGHSARSAALVPADHRGTGGADGWHGRVPSGPHDPGTPPAFPPPTGSPTFPPPTGPPSFPSAVDAPSYPPPTYPAPWPAPGSSPPGGSFPQPGTPQWFGPGHPGPPPPPPSGVNARTVLAAATHGVLITLALGGFIWVLAPVTVVVAFVLTGRISYGRKIVRTAFAAVLAFLGLVGVVALVTADGQFSLWWNTVAGWACFGSWVLIVATIVGVAHAVKQGRPDPPPAGRVDLR